MLTSALTRIESCLLTLLLLFFVPVLQVFAEEIPSTVPPDGVYDPSGYLDQETHDAVTKFNKDHAETDLQPQLGVAIVDYLDQDIESVANQTARNWKVGYKETNHGILLVIGVKDRKMRTEVSDRAATQLTDWKASELNDVLKPHFRNEHYSQGVQAYVAKLTQHFDRLVKKSSGTWSNKKGESLTFGGKIVLGLIVTVSVLALFATLISDLLDSRDSVYDQSDDRTDDTENGTSKEATSDSSHIIHHSGSSANKSNSSDASDLLWVASTLHGSSRSSSSSDDSNHSSSHSHYSSYSSSSSSSSSYDSDYSSSSSSSFSSSDWGGGGFGGGGASGGW